MNINEIEALTEDQAKEMAIETTEIKGHQIYFTDCGEYFGFSCLVFKNGHHIYYANDYRLHHSKDYTDAELRQYYIDALNNKLYTEDELVEPLKDYDDYEHKSYYLRNYYPMQVDRVSFFGNFNDPAYEAWYIKETSKMIRSNYAFCWFYDEAFSKHLDDLASKLEALETEMRQSYDYLKAAFKKEMYNHEYAINWQADWDVLSCFGRVGYNDDDGLEGYFKQLGFNDAQKKAYMDARKEYYREIEEYENRMNESA